LSILLLTHELDDDPAPIFEKLLVGLPADAVQEIVAVVDRTLTLSR
jgi:hypothetical protein